MTAQSSLIEPYVISFAAFTLRGDSWGLAPDERGPAGYGAVVRRAGNVAVYAAHACHMTRAEVTDAGMACVLATLAMAKTVEVEWVTTDTTDTMATTEQARADLAEARALARSRATVTHEPVVRVQLAVQLANDRGREI